MVRLASEGREGRRVRNMLIKSMWHDVKKRAKKLLPPELIGLGSAGREGIGIMGETFKLSLYCYDEGLLCDDHVLASALWRNFFDQKEDIQAKHLETMVHYVRRQLQHLSTMSSED